jgi:very-short-patch-repair endonuclease
MTVKSVQRDIWGLFRAQHGVVSREQLLAYGFTSHGIVHRLEKGRLHRVTPGVYAVGRPELTQHGRWMAAVLSCGPDAVLSHSSAAALWGIRPARGAGTEITVPAGRTPRRPGLTVHRRAAFESTECHGIPVTTAACTLVDLSARLPRNEIEALVNEATLRKLTDPEALGAEIAGLSPRPGLTKLRTTLDRLAITLTRSELERSFFRIVRAAGLPLPESNTHMNGFEVDFLWREQKVVVEADSLTFHRTPAQQTRDRRRDHAHAIAGFLPLRFTHSQITYEPGYVRETLAAVGRFHP